MPYLTGMYLECLERHHCPFELTRCFYFARYLDGIEKLHLTDTVIEFMGGLNAFVPREIDRQLQLCKRPLASRHQEACVTQLDVSHT